MKEIRRNIVTFRKEAGLTQTKLAKKIGVSNAAISMIESGAGSPSLRLAIKIAKALNVTVSDLLGEKIIINKM